MSALIWFYILFHLCGSATNLHHQADVSYSKLQNIFLHKFKQIKNTMQIMLVLMDIIKNSESNSLDQITKCILVSSTLSAKK